MSADLQDASHFEGRRANTTVCDAPVQTSVHAKLMRMSLWFTGSNFTRSSKVSPIMWNTTTTACPATKAGNRNSLMSHIFSEWKWFVTQYLHFQSCVSFEKYKASTFYLYCYTKKPQIPFSKHLLSTFSQGISFHEAELSWNISFFHKYYITILCHLMNYIIYRSTYTKLGI